MFAGLSALLVLILLIIYSTLVYAKSEKTGIFGTWTIYIIIVLLLFNLLSIHVKNMELESRIIEKDRQIESLQSDLKNTFGNLDGCNNELEGYYDELGSAYFGLLYMNESQDYSGINNMVNHIEHFYNSSP